MAVQIERDFAFIFKDENGNLLTLYPKTLASQVVANKKTMADHVYSTSHLLQTEKEALRNAGKPNGYVLLDENGYIPNDNINKSIRNIETEFTTIDDMLTNSAFVVHGALAIVIDASGDPTVNNGWAIYRRDINSDQYWDLDLGWKKIIERETIDLDMDFSHVPGKPNSTSEQIDDMVRSSHFHRDKTLLDLIDEDNSGHMLYDGEKIAYDEEVQRVIVKDYVDDDFRELDFWFKPTYSQSWWDNDAIPYAGSTCYEKYKGREDLIVAPKLLTQDVTSVVRMFYQCKNLEETQQYNTIHCVDFTGQYQDCESLKSVPYMGEYGTLRGLTFDNMFNKCIMLEYSPEMRLDNATSVIAMYSGCINIQRILPFGSTSNITNMKQWFNGCRSLIKITDPIDFSSINLAENVSNMFNECESLEYVQFVPGTLTVSLDLSGTNLSEECLIDIIEGLPVVSTSGDLKQLNISDIPAANVIEDSYLINAAIKGWQVYK